MEPSSRRKACDLCFKKKIRCDGLKPTCSNCSLYSVSCKTTSIRRRPGCDSKQPSVTAKDANTTEVGKDHGLDARLARIEAKLDALRGANNTVSLDQLFEHGVLRDVVEISSGSEISAASSPTNWAGPRPYDGPSVPPLTEALSIAHVYFQNYNSLIPLFDQQLFMRLLNNYYKPYGGKTRIYGAVINVVLSLGYHIQYCEHGDAHAGFNDVKIKACVNNVRAMLDELMTRDQDTLGLQALLGLVILYQTQPDQTASSVLMSAAMRLAHSLRLQSKTVLSELPPQEARQRNNIFWVCYMLDKDISLRTITPSLQLDSDIDIDLPSPANDDHGSVLYSADGLSQFHLFRAKVQLAHLEGRIYDTLFSNRSRKLSHEARREAIAQIDGLLDRWAKSIPTAFQLKNISGNLLKGPLVHMTVLYQTYIMCFTMTHGLYAHNSPWLKALGGLGSDLLRTFNPQHDACMDGGTSSTPVVWEKCVSTSRDILNIFSYQSIGGCSVWLSACSYFTAVTFVLVDLIHHPTGKLAEDDLKLAELSVLRLQKYFDFKGLEKFRQSRNVLVQIEGMARSVLQETRLSRATKAALQAKYGVDSTPLPPPPLAGVFDMGFGQEPATEEPIPTVSRWMGASGFNTANTANTDQAAPPNWPTSGVDPFFGFGL